MGTLGNEAKVVLVAGVGGGLGTALVATLCATKVATVGLARSESVFAKLRGAAERGQWTFRGIVGDVSAQPTIDAAVRATLQEFGRLDAVSVNVGHWISGSSLLHETTEAEWRQGLEDNANAVHRVGRAVIPHFIQKGGGSFVVVSAAPKVREVASPGYALAKAGLADLCQRLAADYRSKGIRFNAILPGNMEGEVDPLSPPDPAAHLPLRDSVGVGAWEVARAIRYLLLDESRWLTGTLLTVDGGRSTRGAEEPPR